MTPSDCIEMPQFAQAENAWNIGMQSMAPGQTTGGNYPVVMTDGGGLWTAKITKIRIRNVNDALTFRAAQLIADGGAQPLIVYRNELELRPNAFTSGIPYSDQSFFSDTAGWAQSNDLVAVNTDAALRATSMMLTLNYTSLSAGHCFSIFTAGQGWRMYMIRRIFPVSDSVVSVEFRPPLREFVAAGTLVETAKPRCTMRLDQPSDMDYMQTRKPYVDQSASFVELLF